MECSALYRFIRSNTIPSGKKILLVIWLQITFKRALHQFDMHIGGTLGNIRIAETDKTKFIISSIMEKLFRAVKWKVQILPRKRRKWYSKRKGLKNKSEQMIMNNYITMKYIVQHKNEAISAEKNIIPT
jgi:hypothetical protein